MKIALRGVILVALLVAAAGVAAAAEGPAKLKLGIYDTRAAAIAWARTPAFAESMRQFRLGHDEAKKAEDQKKVDELEQEGQWRQVRLHQRGFSTAGAADLLTDRKAELAAIAKEAGVGAIVSKWEVPYSDDSVTLVDVTMQVVALFHPDEATLRIITGLKDQAPVPFDELPLDPNE